MRLLITGGAGFIGTNFVYHTLKEHPEDELVCFDALTYASNIKNLEEARKNDKFTFVKGDITNRAAVFDLFERNEFDAVVNLAAESHVDRSITDPGIFILSNIIGTQVLMDACREYRAERFHQVSTDEVYGDLPLDRPDLSFNEESLLRPSSPYSASKAGADLLVQSYHRTYGLKTTISRCSNNYGPYQFPEKFIPKMIILASKGMPLPIYGSGENVRDWLHALDHCRAIDFILRKGRAGEIYNVGANNERRNIDIAKLIQSLVGKSNREISFVKDRPGHDLRYAVDSSKLRNELGWGPAHEFNKGLRETMQWYLDDSNSYLWNISKSKIGV